LVEWIGLFALFLFAKWIIVLNNFNLHLCLNCISSRSIFFLSLEFYLLILWGHTRTQYKFNLIWILFEAHEIASSSCFKVLPYLIQISKYKFDAKMKCTKWNVLIF